LGGRRSGAGEQRTRSDKAALVASGWAGALFVAVGAAGLYLAPGPLLVWALLIGFGVTAMPMALAAQWRDRAGRRREDR
jgi:cyanate permease